MLPERPKTSTKSLMSARRNGIKFARTTTKRVYYPLSPIVYVTDQTVERRRRESINEGINQLARLVPNCDKNKGAILQRTIEYIAHLNDEKKTMAGRLEQNNMTLDHAIADIYAQNTKLKAEVNRRGDIAQKWLQRCRDAGLHFEDFNDSKELDSIEVDQDQA